MDANKNWTEKKPQPAGMLVDDVAGGFGRIVGDVGLCGLAEWLDSNASFYLIMNCTDGEAELSLMFRPYRLSAGMTVIVDSGMFPAFISVSAGFTASYVFVDREFAENAFYSLPVNFFDAVYIEPAVPMGAAAGRCLGLIGDVCRDTSNPYRKDILKDLLHAFASVYYHEWRQNFGRIPDVKEPTMAKQLCNRFYNLIFEGFREHRDIAYYAGQLCITPCYLAMLTRKICHETPKQAVNRLVMLDIKHKLKNTDMTNSQIADSLHFPDTSYMCRFFRRETGLSPSEFRERSRS